MKVPTMHAIAAIATLVSLIHVVTARPSLRPTVSPSLQPSDLPSDQPSSIPSDVPSDWPSSLPSDVPSDKPSSIAESSVVQTSLPLEISMQQGNTFPAVDGQTRNLFPQSGAADPANVVCGAVQSVLPHPTDPDICFAGAVDGGVWRTTSCTADEPDWQPLTDNEESLAVADMVFDDDDPTGNTILVGLGSRSSFYRSGGISAGLLYTTNALDPVPTWQHLDNAAGAVNFRDDFVKFSAVFVRGDLMMAAAILSDTNSCDKVGLFRSIDRGVTWTNVFQGVGRALASDPNDPDRFYATFDLVRICQEGLNPPNGVYTSIDGGLTWVLTDPTLVANVEEGKLNNAS